MSAVDGWDLLRYQGRGPGGHLRRRDGAPRMAAWCQACRLDDELFGRLAMLARRGHGPVPTCFAWKPSKT